MILLLIGISVNFSSCRKDTGDQPDQPQSFTGLQVDDGFTFNTTELLDVSISIIPVMVDEEPHIIRFYTDDPEEGGKLISSATTADNLQYKGSIKTPCSLKQIFVTEISAEGVSRSAYIVKSGNGFMYEFGGEIKSGQEKTMPADPGCEECDVLLTGTENALIQPGMRYCVEEGASWNGLLKYYNGGELVVCGTADIYLHPSTGGGTIYISEGGEVEMDDLYLKNNLLVENYGTLQVNSVFSVAFGGTLQNYSVINCEAITNYGNSGGITNEGTLNANTFVNNLGNLINNGTINAGSYFSNNSTALLQNNCRIDVEAHFNQVGTLNIAPGALLQVGGIFDSWNGAQTSLSDQAMILTYHLEVEGTISGPVDGCARLQVTDETQIKPAGTLNGFLDLCDENGLEINNGIIGPEVTNCTCFIPQTACNPTGAGSPPVLDTDGDGVPDDLDDYPTDPDRAFNSFYPNETDYGTMAFEDLWPALGDYDFNDLVIEFQYQMVTNAQNKYVDLTGRFLIKAVGGSRDNGFGFVLDVPSSLTESVSGTVISGEAVTLAPEGYESGHSGMTVVLVYDAVISMANWSMINTTHGGNTMEFEPVEIVVHFAEAQETIGEPPYNPFIFIGQQREKELHMIDQPPTTLAGSQHFGTYADASDPGSGQYYKTASLLPWVIEIPVSFDYPVEKSDIILSHLRFAEWATSGGTSCADWYMELPGYRDASKIY